MRISEPLGDRQHAKPNPRALASAIRTPTHPETTATPSPAQPTNAAPLPFPHDRGSLPGGSRIPPMITAWYWPGVSVATPSRRAISLKAYLQYSSVNQSDCASPRACPSATRWPWPDMNASARTFSHGRRRCSQMRLAAGAAAKRSFRSRAASQERVLSRRGSPAGVDSATSRTTWSNARGSNSEAGR